MRKKQTHNLRLAQRGVVRHNHTTVSGGDSTPQVVIYFDNPREPGRPYRLALSLTDASELAGLIDRAANSDSSELVTDVIRPAETDPPFNDTDDVRRDEDGA